MGETLRATHAYMVTEGLAVRTSDVMLVVHREDHPALFDGDGLPDLPSTPPPSPGEPTTNPPDVSSPLVVAPGDSEEGGWSARVFNLEEALIAAESELAALRSKLEAAERERDEANEAEDQWREDMHDAEAKLAAAKVRLAEALALAEEAVRFLWGVDECDIIAARQKATDLTARLAKVKGDQDG